ncbi:ADP-ribosylation_factor [Hexamita inflata]|uniref:ADP-ribosylation factor n=1 Tax=Hexamita inflata TaxID=28002 RepID=A0AA86TDT1_9EUKA|nr:ADP-ribosylation factor [Hexamita inflata]
MGLSNFSKIFGKLFSKNDIHILVLGLDAAGKTTILKKLNLGEAIAIPNIDFHIEMVEHKGIKFLEWDLGGCGIRHQFIPQCLNSQIIDAIIYVVDSCDQDPFRIQDSKVQLQKLMTEDRLQDAALLVFANKQDLPKAMSLSDLSEKLELNSYINREQHIQACSAKTGEGLQQGFEWLSTIINERYKRTK